MGDSAYSRMDEEFHSAVDEETSSDLTEAVYPPMEEDPYATMEEPYATTEEPGLAMEDTTYSSADEAIQSATEPASSPETASEYESEIPSKYDFITAAEDDSSGPLTVGFELEVLFPTLPSEQALDPHMFEHGEIYKGQGRNGRESLLDEEDAFDEWLLGILRREMPHDRFRKQMDDVFESPHENVPLYDAWRLTKDGSLVYRDYSRVPSMPLGYDWIGREITSEVLNTDDIGTYTKKIKSICTALRQVRIHLNDTTSVHVHVGHGEEAFSLLTLKKFATLLWLTDAAILKLHHPDRHKNEYCCPVSSNSSLAMKTLEEFENEKWKLDQGGFTQMGEFVPETFLGKGLLAAQIRRIWGTDDMEDLAELMMCRQRTIGERGSVGFRRFLPAGKTGGNIQTFKWRQMAGCLEPLPIIYWINFCVGFTNFARLSDAATYKQLITTILKNGGQFSGFSLLETLGLQVEAAYFRCRVTEYEHGQVELFEGEEEEKLFLKPLQ